MDWTYKRSFHFIKIYMLIIVQVGVNVRLKSQGNVNFDARDEKLIRLVLIVDSR